MEWQNYKAKGGNSPITDGVFALILSLLTIITAEKFLHLVPEISEKVKT